MKILVAMEYSGRIRDAFIARGHDAMSCDFLSSERPGPHHQGDVVPLIRDGHWDMIIAHPECTYLCNSGVWGLYHDTRGCTAAERWRRMYDAADLFKFIYHAPCGKVVIENPIPHKHAHLPAYSQTIQPHDFGEDASKRTCLWLRGVPPLVGTSYFPPRVVSGKKRWGNQTDSGQNRLAPSDHRWKDRSRTYQGIADAMADQWGI